MVYILHKLLQFLQPMYRIPCKSDSPSYEQGIQDHALRLLPTLPTSTTQFTTTFNANTLLVIIYESLFRGLSYPTETPMHLIREIDLFENTSTEQIIVQHTVQLN